MLNRVVITGIGTVSGFGLTKNDFWSGISQGRSAKKTLRFGDTLRMRSGYTLDNYNPDDHFASDELPLLDRFSQLAIIAAREALLDSGIQPALLNNTAVVIGSGSGGKHTDEEGYSRLYKQGNPRVHPLMIPKGMHSAVASNISMNLGLNGPALTVCSACSSGAHAIIQGVMMVQMGVADSAVVGGSDAPFSFGILKAWDALRVVTNNEYRPFSKDRSGIVLGEGAGIFTIETLESAKSRGAKIYAEITGYGMSSDAKHITDPDINGIQLAISRALSSADLTPADIDYINAHGTGTRLNDQIESQAINLTFGEYAMKPLVSSTKAMHGHALGASSALEIAATALAMQHHLIPPTINYSEKDDDCNLNLVTNTAKNKEINTAMSNSFAFGGLNAVIILKKVLD